MFTDFNICHRMVPLGMLDSVDLDLDLGRRPNSNQERHCVLGFSANRVWLVSRFIYFLGFGDRKPRYTLFGQQ